MSETILGMVTGGSGGTIAMVVAVLGYLGFTKWQLSSTKKDLKNKEVELEETKATDKVKEFQAVNLERHDVASKELDAELDKLQEKLSVDTEYIV